MMIKVVAFIAAAFLFSACTVSGQGQKQTGGTLIGAGLGALAGSQIGSGRGQLAAVAIGTLAGSTGSSRANRPWRGGQEK